MPFAPFVYGFLKTIFFAEAVRMTVPVVTVFMFFLPNIGRSRRATNDFIRSVVGTST